MLLIGREMWLRFFASAHALHTVVPLWATTARIGGPRELVAGATGQSAGMVTANSPTLTGGV